MTTTIEKTNDGFRVTVRKPKWTPDAWSAILGFSWAMICFGAKWLVVK